MTPSARHTGFQSILFRASRPVRQEAPDFFADLNIDQIVAGLIAGREEYDLAPFFYTLLTCVEDISYRYEVLQDFQNADLLGYVRTFTHEMKTVRAHLAQSEKHYYQRQKQSAFLDAVDRYCGAVTGFAQNLAKSRIESNGFLAFRDFLREYVNSSGFRTIADETQRLKSELGQIKYRLHIEGKRITVSKYDEEEPDYRAEVLATFDKFKEGGARDYHFGQRFTLDMNHVEAAILDLVVRLYPEVFSSLDSYTGRHAQFVDDVVAQFDREVQFYLACIDYIEPLKQAGLPFCFPAVSDRSKEINGHEVFDLALASRLVREGDRIVTNDFFLQDPERVIVVTGPNQGGKTTFARTLGQMHYLAAIGCPAPGSSAHLFLFDKLFTHFEREEDIGNLSGKLEDELLRIHTILSAATPGSILIMNESFLSTTLNDAIFLSKKVMARVVGLDMLCVSVTFLDELATFSNSTVSMVSTVNMADGGRRTFKIVRRPADGLAYAAVIAEKYRLTYDGVRARIEANRTKRMAS
ncbi:MAG TPA: hypothetical protein VG722_13330 [Tepidisphaeraceae bacterium]|nr:hypothetical protein [Tepidisphaeraceae bacterium]